MFNNLKNQKGSILVMALGVAVFCATSASLVGSQLIGTDRMAKLPQIRSLMTQVETRVRALALTPNGYNCGDTGPTSCSINQGAFAALAAETSGGNVRPMDVTMNFADPTAPNQIIFTARIVYTAAGGSIFTSMGQVIREGRIRMQIPFEILQESTFECPDATPLFTGYKQTMPDIGSPQCRAATFTPCPVGQYMIGLNPATLQPICNPIGRSFTCADTDFVRQYSWDGLSNVGYSCQRRLSPFENGFAMSVTADNTFLQDPNTPDPTYYIPSPTYVSWVNPDPEPPGSCTPVIPPPVIQGVCHPSTNGGFFAFEPSPLCLTGNPTTVDNTTPSIWRWQCVGQNGGLTRNCSASRPVPPVPQPGICGASHAQTFTSQPSTGLCNQGSVSGMGGSGPWAWSCLGQNGGANASCYANYTPPVLNGACGSANGVEVPTAPTSNLCSAGTATAVAGTGPFTWSCMGSGGGTNDNCSAPLAPTKPPRPTLTVSWGGCGGSTSTEITDDNNGKRHLGEEGGGGSGLSQTLCLGSSIPATATITSSWQMYGCSGDFTFTGVGDDIGSSSGNDSGMPDLPSLHSLKENNRRPNGSTDQKWCVGLSDQTWYQIEALWHPVPRVCPAGWQYIFTANSGNRDLNSEAEGEHESLCLRIWDRP